MDEYRLNILKQSNAEINRLQLLSAFFDEEIIYKIYLRAQVIHQLFAGNEDLELEKLDLFHLQFTSSVIELLKKIKKSNEKSVSLIYDEIHLNEELISRMANATINKASFNIDKQRQALKVNNALRKLYEVLSGLNSDFPFPKNINAFSSKYANDFYFDLNTEQLAKLIDYQGKQVYANSSATIEKKLMGSLCKYEFRSEFFMGLKSGEMIVEIYKISAIDRHFIFFPSRNLFQFCDLTILEGLDQSNNLSEKERIVQELEYKNDKLASNAAILKQAIPAEVIKLLEDSYLKISDINFLNHLNNFDVQSNVLKAMLKTDLF